MNEQVSHPAIHRLCRLSRLAVIPRIVLTAREKEEMVKPLGHDIV